MVGDGKTGQESGTTSKVIVTGLGSKVMDHNMGGSAKLSGNCNKSELYQSNIGIFTFFFALKMLPLQSVSISISLSICR